MKTEDKAACFDKLHNLYVLYANVRHAVILAENFNARRQMPIAPLNQLRNALDHIFNAVNKANNMDEQFEHELKEAQEHINRAGYDALELLAGNLGTKILERLNSYTSTTISTVFPTYYSDIRPRITAIKKDVAILRAEKEIDTEKSFSAYFDQISELIEIDKKVDTFIPALDDFERKRKKETQRHWLITAGITALGCIITLILTLLFC